MKFTCALLLIRHSVPYFTYSGYASVVIFHYSVNELPSFSYKFRYVWRTVRTSPHLTLHPTSTDHLSYSSPGKRRRRSSSICWKINERVKYNKLAVSRQADGQNQHQQQQQGQPEFTITTNMVISIFSKCTTPTNYHDTWGWINECVKE